MCGINGIFAYRPGARSIDQRMLVDTRDRMTARGPDGQGLWLSADGRVGLAHRRLSIIDLSDTGAQPMSSADGLVVTFNGEIYSYRQLRDALEAGGRRFRSSSDTEVLLHLYAEKGEAMVQHLRGMFAFGLWDEKRGTLLLARDPYGIKPLYYADIDGQLSFASSVKALVDGNALSRTFDPAGVAGFLVFGSVPAPWTIYDAVRAVPPGSTLLIDEKGVHQPRRYHSIAKVITAAERAAAESETSPNASTDTLRDALLDSVRHHLVADVPVGAFLSAGVDSGALVGLMRDAGQDDIQTITLAYEEYRGQAADEAPLAETVARHYGTRHTTRWITAQEFHDDLPRIMAAMDQPSVDGINTWFVSKAARELGLKVALSGVGGDELLGGYGTFRSVPRLARLLAVPSQIAGLPFLMQHAVGLARAVGIDVHPKQAGLFRYGGSVPGAYLLQRSLYLPFELRKQLRNRELLEEGLRRLDPPGLLAGAIAGGPQTEFGKIAALESMFYLGNQLLRDTDWSSMAHSLEVRTPLIDHVLLERAAPVMLSRNPPSGKVMLAQAPRRPLPEEIVNRRKTGFGIPIESWLAQTPRPGAGLTPRSGRFSRNWAHQVAAWQHVL